MARQARKKKKKKYEHWMYFAFAEQLTKSAIDTSNEKMGEFF